MVITSAVRQKNNPEMIRIYIDNVYAFSMPEEQYLKMNLYERGELTQEEIETIRNEVNVKLAKQRAIKLLTARDRSEFEVKERLIKQGFDKEAADDAIMELKAMGYINDRLFAHKYVSDRLKLKPKSKKALAYELCQKGIESELITEVVNEYELDESSIAYRIARKKYGKYDAADPEVQRKIASFLSHRGFSYEIIREVITALME